jgi:LasA protease
MRSISSPPPILTRIHAWLCGIVNFCASLHEHAESVRQRTFVICAIFTLTLAACSQPAAEPAATATPTIPIVPAATQPLKLRDAAASSTPRIAPTRAPGLTPSPDPLRGIAAQGIVTSTYVVQNGDTLGGIALQFGADPNDLRQLNGLTSDALRIGQALIVRVPVIEHGPVLKLIPDSELVNGPGAVGFDPSVVVDAQRGYLAGYVERVGDETLSGVQIVQRVADQTSVHPRLLLAALEYAGGWVSNPNPSGDALLYPLGNQRANLKGLYVQLSWAAGRLNEGYYGWRLNNRYIAQFSDGSYTFLGDGINAGTAGLQNWIALIRPRNAWRSALLDDGNVNAFLTTYRKLFGDPWRFDQGEPVPPGTRQPEFDLPWAADETWFFTGGPHAAWGRGTPWGALDFTTISVGGCSALPEWATAMADGTISRSSRGEVVQALDPSGDDRIGWSVLYLHLGSRDRVSAGTPVRRGDKLGHPSCEGGISYAAHIHLVRRFNGEWINATGAIPFVMSGWQAAEGGKEYDGTLVRGAASREACECKNAAVNGVKK